jgi:hypothetical protein
MPTKPFALIPAYSHVDRRLTEALGQAGVPYHAFHECSDLPKARSQLISAGLAQTDADVFVLIDSDMTPSAAQIAALIGSPKLGPTSAVSGAYPTRTGQLACRPKDLSANIELGAPGFTELEAAGLGFCAITRASLEAVASCLVEVVEQAGNWRPFCVPYVEGPRYYPDDYSLWRRVAALGHSLWLDNALLVPHVISQPRAIVPGLVTKLDPAPAFSPPARKRGKKAPSKRTRARRRQ